MTADERLRLVQAKIERAKEHINDVYVASSAFLNSDVYAISVKRDPQTRQLIYYLSKATSPPTSIALVTGDAIHNLRSALDHLAQQLYIVGTGNAGPGLDIYFPIDSNAKQYKANAPGKIKGLRQDAIDALDRIEPYKGGNGHDFWVLNRLDNIDKHRLLVTVAADFKGVHLWPLLERVTKKHFPPELAAAFANAKIPSLLIREKQRKPLEEGDALFIDAPDAEPDQNMKFTLEIALHEPGVIESKPLMEALQRFADLVSSTVLSFRSCLS